MAKMPIFVLLAIAVVGLGSCGSDDDIESVASETSTTTPTRTENESLIVQSSQVSSERSRNVSPPSSTDLSTAPPVTQRTSTTGSASTISRGNQTGITAQRGDANDAYGGGGVTNCPAFPSDNWWNEDISSLPVHPRSGSWVSNIGSGNLHPVFGTIWEGKAIGVPYIIVDGDQPRVPVSFQYASESEPGPYPIPATAPIEDFVDRHVVVIDDTNCKLYEMFDAKPIDGGTSWQAVSGAVFDLTSNDLRPDGWTSADAAGLPIYPGLVTYEEVVVEKQIDHALRFTASRTQRAYIKPATHYASTITDPNVAPLGARFRLKASFDCSSFSAEVQVICTAMKKYGMFLADNGMDWHVVGSPDPRWDDSALGHLKRIPGSAFEVVDTGEPIQT